MNTVVIGSHNTSAAARLYIKRSETQELAAATKRRNHIDHIDAGNRARKERK